MITADTAAGIKTAPTSVATVKGGTIVMTVAAAGVAAKVTDMATTVMTTNSKKEPHGSFFF
jgi:ribonuclease HII